MVFRLSKLAPLSILLISIYSILNYFDIDYNFSLIQWTVSISILILFLFLPIFSIHQQPMVPVKLLMLYYFFSIVRGFFIAEIYWDYKALVQNGVSLFLAVVALNSINVKMTRDIFVFYLKYTVPLLLIIFPFIEAGAIGFYIAPFSLLLLFIPLLPRLISITILFLVFYVVSQDLGARSNVIKFLVPLVFLLFYYFHLLRSQLLMNVVRYGFLFLPIVLFSLAVSGKFNVFKMQDYIKADASYSSKNLKGEVETEDLRADTRTFLYEENLYTAFKFNSWWLGRSPARGYETVFFKEESLKNYGRPERQGCEVAILNIFTWTGLIGVILYFIVFYQASNLAINKSRNIFSQILGMYIAFRWFYAWVEDINYFTSTTFTLWIAIGLCYSQKFRAMSNLEVKLWIRGIRFKKIGNKIFLLSKSSTI